MSLKVTPYAMAQHGRVLATREMGREVGREVQDSFPDEGAVILVFQDVDVASPPFLDELIRAVRSVVDASEGGRHVLLAGFNDDVKECLKMVLERQKLVMAGITKKRLDLLGGPEHLQHTLEEAQALGTFTSPELAERLKMKLPALHQRLQTLMDAGVLVREEDPTAERGVRHTYRTPPVKTLVGK